MILGILILRVFDLVSAQLFYLSYITACVVTLISCYVIYSRLPYRHVAKQSANPAFWPTSYVMYGMLVFNIIAVNLPQILTGYFLSSADVGLLAVCIRITNLVAFLLTAMTGVMGPKIAQLYADQDIKNTRRVLTMLVYMALLFSTTVCITLVIFDDQILGLFGGDYVAAKTVLHLLAVSQVFLLINGIGKLLLQMSAHEKSARRISMLYAVSLLLSMVILTPLFGIEGTAMAMMLISFMSMLVSIVVVKKQMGLFLFAPGWQVTR
jgi:O-antigen/teichoic acid export membrane protein